MEVVYWSWVGIAAACAATAVANMIANVSIEFFITSPFGYITLYQKLSLYNVLRVNRLDFKVIKVNVAVTHHNISGSAFAQRFREINACLALRKLRSGLGSV
jgi:hypothetical protein